MQQQAHVDPVQEGPMPPGSGGDLVNFKAPNGLKNKIPAGKKSLPTECTRTPFAPSESPRPTRSPQEVEAMYARACNESFNGHFNKNTTKVLNFAMDKQNTRQCLRQFASLQVGEWTSGSIPRPHLPRTALLQ
jgi:hypothetical protein